MIIKPKSYITIFLKKLRAILSIKNELTSYTSMHSSMAPPSHWLSLSPRRTPSMLAWCTDSSAHTGSGARTVRSSLSSQNARPRTLCLAIHREHFGIELKQEVVEARTFLLVRYVFLRIFAKLLQKHTRAKSKVMFAVAFVFTLACIMHATQ